jgi:hypothetical protein
VNGIYLMVPNPGKDLERMIFSFQIFSSTPNIQQTLTYTQPGEDDLQRAVEELSWV